MLADMFIKIINSLISAISLIVSSVLNLLPNSPFSNLDFGFIENQYLSSLAWVVPFKAILQILTSSLFVVVSYYVYQVILRWVKAIK